MRKKQRATRRIGISTATRQRAQRANQVWSWDIIHDQTQAGSSLRILTLIDECTKQCLAIEVGRSIRALDAIRVLDGAIKGYGRPEHIRSDNGPEFIAEAIRQRMSTAQIKSLYIQPGSPWEQAYIESFHDKFRDECLNRELFATLTEARVIIESWRREYNQMRPHSALGYLTPDECHNILQQPKWSAENRGHMLGFDSPPAPMRDLSTIAFFRTVALLRRHGPVPGILAARRSGAIMDKSGRPRLVTF